jgi:hypothetical protein
MDHRELDQKLVAAAYTPEAPAIQKKHLARLCKVSKMGATGLEHP